MLFKTATALFLSANVFASAMREKRQSSADLASVESEASVPTLSSPYLAIYSHCLSSVLLSKFPGGSTTVSLAFVTPGGNLPQPPASLVGVIITAVPASILIELAQPSLRSSIASEFKAGNTPQWYATLPSAVKSYIESLESFVAAGDVNLSARPTATFQFTAADPTSITTSEKGKGGTVATSTSKAAAAQEIAGLGIGMAAALGILGVAIAL